MFAGVAERSPNQEWPSAWKRRSLVKETSPETSASHAKTIALFQDPRSHLQTLQQPESMAQGVYLNSNLFS